MQELTEAHRRALGALAILTEQKLLEIELAFIKAGFHQPLHLSFLNDLTIEKKDALRKIMEQLKKALKELGTEYGIKREENSIQKEVYTKTVFLWEMLCEYTDHRLNNYGVLDEGVIRDIDKRVNNMIDLAMEMQKACE